MNSFDHIEFFHAILTAFFLGSLTTLVPKLLQAFSTAIEPHSPHIACWLDNLHNQNPFQQWMAESKLRGELLRRRLRLLDGRNGMFLTNAESRKLVCPTRKWFLVCMAYVLLFVSVNVLGALTIMWEETTAVRMQHEDAIFPAFPVEDGASDGLKIRGNCRESLVEGSGSTTHVGYVLFQMCVDVFDSNLTDALRKNEVRGKYKGKYYRLSFYLETLTAEGVDENWRIDQHNANRLVDTPGLIQDDEYLKHCDEDCEGRIRNYGVPFVMAQEVLKTKVGLVKRNILNYDTEVKEFKLEDHLFERKTRLKTEAWVTMLAVTIVALLWTLVSIITNEGETMYATAARMNRDLSSTGPTSITTMLEPGVLKKPSFVVVHHPLRDPPIKQEEVSGPLSSDVCREYSYRASDLVDASGISESEVDVLLKVAKYSYAEDSGEFAKSGMIIVAYREEIEDSS